MPEECPQEIADLIQQCKLVEPKQRPSAKEVFEILRKNCMAKRYNDSVTWSCCHEQFAVHACNVQVLGLGCINLAYLPCFILHLFHCWQLQSMVRMLTLVRLQQTLSVVAC